MGTHPFPLSAHGTWRCEDGDLTPRQAQFLYNCCQTAAGTTDKGAVTEKQDVHVGEVLSWEGNDLLDGRSQNSEFRIQKNGMQRRRTVDRRDMAKRIARQEGLRLRREG